jgi:signal transduction histidine kinase
VTVPNPPADAAVRERLAPPRNPLVMLVSPVGWRAVLYCATSIVGGLLALLAGILGLFMLPLVTWATTNIERARLVVLGLPRLTPLPRSGVRHPWDTRGFGEGNLAVWGITVLFALVDLVPGLVLSALVLGLGTALLPVLRRGPPGVELLYTAGGFAVVLVVGLYVAWALAAAQAILVDLQLRPYSELSRRVDELTESRRELVDVFAEERRRIERDLHDGAQQHLVLLSLHLGEAEYALGQGRPEDARQALDAAQGSVEAAMTSLRDTVRGIHPQILSDRGLGAAVRELAARQPVPVRVEVSGGTEPAEPVALAAYYLVSEAFTNVAKHARATSMSVRVALADPLEVEVYDDGTGGARVVAGHGLSGLMERAQAVGGTCWLSSPDGGPTLLRASFPGGRA